MPTPEGRPEGDQWVVVRVPEGKGPGETFEHINHNGRYMMTVTVPEGAKAGDTLGTPGNKRRTSARERQRRAERRAATVERATAERDATEIAAEITADEQAVAERATDERAAAKRATDAEAKRLVAAIAAQSDARSAACGLAQGGGHASFTTYGDLQP